MAMINLTIGNNMKRETVMIDSSETLRAAVEQAGIDMCSGVASLDGSSLRPGDMDSTFDDFDMDPNVRHFMMFVQKADNAASACVVGSSLVVTSSAKYDDIKLLNKYRPNALRLYEDKECVYAVGTANGMGSIGKFGAAFSARTDAEGHATITVDIPEDVTDPKAWAEEYLGVSILNLNKVEEQFAPMLEEVAAEKAAVAAAITMA